MRNFLRKKLFLIIWLVIIVVGFSFIYFVLAYNPGTNFTLCTSTVTQPSCYSGSFPTPTLNWTVTGSSSQNRYWVQIDNNSSFSSPEIDSGEISSTDKFYQVSTAGLSFEKSYYWRVKIRDNFDSWSDWVNADTAFTTVSLCNNPPTATNLSVTKGDYCAYPDHYFSWTYSDPDGDDESQFQFQVDDNSDFSSPEVDQTVTGTWSDGDSNNQTVVVAVSPGADQISYNTTYYWRVKVWDSGNNDSGWVEGSLFTTEEHRYPLVDFNWSPTEPSQGEDVLFADQSTVYGGSTKSAWSWTFEDGNPASTSQQNPTIQFTADGSKEVTLGVTDSDNFYCQVSKTVGVQVALPGWQEILPQ